MLLEFKGGRQVSYRVNPQHSGAVETVHEIYAADYFKEMGGDVFEAPKAPNSPHHSAGTTAATASSAKRRLRRRVQATLERIFLPAGYPNSVTDDLLTFALWDAAQVLATNVMATLSTRAVLLGVGVGESGANLTSSTLSWMMRDGTWLIGSIFFASVISQDLEYRAKSWRLVADFTNDTATFLELCAPLFPGGQLTFRLVVVIASVIKALVGVCGGGTRASFTQHFALRSNAADVAAKAGTRGNVGSLIGLALGLMVAYVVPATSTVLNLTVFVLSTSFHLFANYKGVRGVQLRHLNAPRLEWCCAQFHTFQEQALRALKKESTAMPVLDISVRRANAEEPLFVLPALPEALPTLHNSGGAAGGLAAAAYRFARHHLCPPTLKLRLYCGASFHAVLAAQTQALSTARKQQLVHRVSESLSVRGIALLYDAVVQSYYVILPEFYTVEGVPESWVRYKRQYEAGRRAEEKTKHHEHRAGAGPASSSTAPSAGTAGGAGAKNSARDTAAVGEDGEGEVYKTAAEEAEEEAQAEMERLRKEKVVVPPHVLPLAYRELWAFFYAYMHHQAVCERRARGQSPQRLGRVKDNAEEHNTLHLITHLRADGMLPEGRADSPDKVRARRTEQQGVGADGKGKGSNDEDVDQHSDDDDGGCATMVDPDTFEEMTSPTSTTSSKIYPFPTKAGKDGSPETSAVVAEAEAAAAAAGIAPQDGLYPLFIEFVRVLRKTGWELDRLLLDNEGCTTVVHYM